MRNGLNAIPLTGAVVAFAAALGVLRRGERDLVIRRAKAARAAGVTAVRPREST
jgi:hypothetical protein